MALKTLVEHDLEQIAAHNEKNLAINTPVPVGILCPTCGSELHNPTPTVLIGDAEPHRMNVSCTQPSCRYTGTAIAFV